MVKNLLFENCANCGKKIDDEEKALLLDSHNGLIFCNEKCLQENFEAEITNLQEEHLRLRSPQDIPPASFSAYASFLPLVLNEPDEIWETSTDEDTAPVSFFIGEFIHEQEQIFYIAGAYFAEDKPAFVYIHFPTRDMDLVQKYKRGTLVFDSMESEGDLEDEEIDEDNIAYELHSEMIENRSDADIDIADFSAYDHLKILTVENPEEVWRRIDEVGNTFLLYISHHLGKDQEETAYVVVAVEDDISESAIPVFGFPTLDQKLLDRFRKGELVFKTAPEDF